MRLPWARVEFGDGRYTSISCARRRRGSARFGLKIYTGASITPTAPEGAVRTAGPQSVDQQVRNFLRDLGRWAFPWPRSISIRQHLHHRHGGAARLHRPRVRSRGLPRQGQKRHSFDREYSADEMWTNYTYFMKAVPLGGCGGEGEAGAASGRSPGRREDERRGQLYTRYNGYHRAEQDGHSPWWGLALCCGTWSEGGDRMGKNVSK